MSHCNTYRVELFIMDVTLPHYLDAGTCCVGLTCGNTPELFTKTSKVMYGMGELESTLHTQLKVPAASRLQHQDSYLARFHVYITPRVDPNNHSLVGSLTVNLAEEVAKRENRLISEYLVTQDVRVRLSINCFLESEVVYPHNSILKDIQNLEESTEQENKLPTYGYQYKNTLQQRPILNYLVEKQEEELNFSEIIPADTSSKMNEMNEMNESFEYNKHRELYLEVVRVNEEVLKVKEENRGLNNEVEDLRQINSELDEINIKLSDDLRESDEKFIRLERQLNFYKEKVFSLESVKLEAQTDIEQEKKNSEEVEKRNQQIMAFVDELQENELKLNHTIDDLTFKIEELEEQMAELKRRDDKGNEIKSLSTFNKAVEEWRRGNATGNTQERQLQIFTGPIHHRMETRAKQFHENVIEQLQKVSLELVSLKRKYLFESEVSIINMVSHKIECILSSV